MSSFSTRVQLHGNLVSIYMVIFPFSLSLLFSFSISLLYTNAPYVGMLECWAWFPFSISLFLCFCLSLFLSFSLYFSFSMSLFLALSLSLVLSLSLSRYPPVHPNNTTMASCMRAVAAVAWHLSQRFFQTLGIQCGLPYCFPVACVAQLACVCSSL